MGNELLAPAHWVLFEDCANEGVYCSGCHKKVYRKHYANQVVASNFCPNCGAPMTGVKKLTTSDVSPGYLEVIDAIAGLELCQVMMLFDPNTGDDLEISTLEPENRELYQACGVAIRVMKERLEANNEQNKG